ncbi:MAG: cyclic-di-AMP receptor [Anaerolineales bacterium]
MKLILAILRDQDCEPVTNALIAAGLGVTQIASTGGFLRRGSTTMLIGVDAERVDEAVQLVDKNCSPADSPDSKRATLFVLKVDQFTQL